MRHEIVELLEDVVLQKKECQPLKFEKGNILKVVDEYHANFLVSTDQGFTFTLAKIDEGKAWKRL